VRNILFVRLVFGLESKAASSIEYQNIVHYNWFTYPDVLIVWNIFYGFFKWSENEKIEDNLIDHYDYGPIFQLY
jgi:hypothetical protein